MGGRIEIVTREEKERDGEKDEDEAEVEPEEFEVGVQSCVNAKISPEYEGKKYCKKRGRKKYLF